MRTLGWCFGFALLVPCMTGSAQEFKWKEVRTAHYVVKTNGPVSLAQDGAAFLEAFYATYAALVGNAEKGAIGSLRVFESWLDFKKVYAAGVVTSYTPAAREIDIWHGEGDESRIGGQAGYQFQHLYFGQDLVDGVMPPWLNRGMSECMSNGEMRKKRYYVGVPYGSRPREYIPAVAKMIQEDQAPSLEQFLLMDEARFGASPGSRAMAWSVCHFLLCYPELGQGEQDKPLPQGKYANVLTRLFQGLKKGGASKDRKELYRQAFVTKQNRPIDLAELEKEWRQYVTDFAPYFTALDKEAADKFQKAVELAKERKWSEVRELLDKFATLYRNTPTYEWNQTDLSKLAEMAKRGADGKDNPASIVFFAGKEIAFARVVDIKQNPKAWRVENRLLIGESEAADLTYYSTSLMGWSLTAVFKLDKDASKGETWFGISSQNKTNDTLESWDRGVRFYPATGELETYEDTFQARHPTTLLKKVVEPSKDGWNTLTLIQEWSHVTVEYNKEKVFEYDLEKHDSMPGYWALHICKGRVAVKSAVLTIK